jgi:hypothetical protein
VNALGFSPPPLYTRQMTHTEWSTANAQAGRPASWRPGDDKPEPPPVVHPDRCARCGRTVQWFATVSEWLCDCCGTRLDPQPKPPGHAEPKPKSQKDNTYSATYGHASMLPYVTPHDSPAEGVDSTLRPSHTITVTTSGQVPAESETSHLSGMFK